MIISVTLLPALLAMLGDNVNRLRVPLMGRGTEERGGVWGVITDRVLARPAVLAVVTLAALLAVASPFATLNLGFNGAKGLPDAVEAKKALLALQENFTLGLISPAMVVVDAGEKQNIFAADPQGRVSEFTSLVQAETVSAENPNAPYGSPIQSETNDAGDAEVVRIPINADTGEEKGIDAVNHLRDDLIPRAFGGGPGRALVTGDTAINIDFRDNIIFRTPFVFTFVLGLAFIILLVNDEMALRLAELRGDGRFLLGRLKGNDAGVIGWYEGEDRFIFQVATRLPFRRRGVARALLCHVVADAYARSCRSVIINANAEDTPIHLYRSLGFTDEVYWRRQYTLKPG